MAFSGGGPSKAEMNVTPLIDVLLVLIIVFMVAVSMSQEKGLKAQIPEPVPEHPNQPPLPDRTIVIQVVGGAPDQAPSLKINQDDVGWDNLKSRLQEIFKARAERVAFVRGDQGIEFQYVADVIDIAHNAGVEKVGLLTNQNL